MSLLRYYLGEQYIANYWIKKGKNIRLCKYVY